MKTPPITLRQAPGTRFGGRFGALFGSVFGSLFGQALGPLIQNEIRLRTRRLSSLIALFVVMLASWHLIVDPTQGYTMMEIDGARVLYSSSALSQASAIFAATLFSLLGFYLVRGRVGEDLRSGVGSVIAATPVGNARFLLARWIGGVAYLASLLLGMIVSIMLLHLFRGDGPLQIWVYLLNYSAILLPNLLFCVGMALLFDSIPFLMGKRGDVLFFIIWTVQLGLMSKLEALAAGTIGSGWLLLDFTGIASGILTLQNHFHTTNFSVGYNSFDPKLTPILLPAMLWSGKVLALRGLTSLLALLPLVLAALCFHRYSPDKVKASHASTRRNPLQMINQWLRPLARLVQPLFRLAGYSPGPAGKVMAELALTLAGNPVALLVLMVGVAVSSLTEPTYLAGVLLPLAAIWGILISDIGSREQQADLMAIGGSVPGGAHGRFWQKLGAAVLLGLLLLGPIALRLALHQPLYAAALLSGLLLLSVLATVLGYLSGTGRTFLVLFLFWLHLALNARDVALLDLLGFNRAVDWAMLGQHGLLALAVLAAGWGWLRWRAW